MLLAQAAGVLPGTPNSTSQAHRRGALFFGVVVPILPLERGIMIVKPETHVGWHRQERFNPSVRKAGVRQSAQFAQSKQRTRFNPLDRQSHCPDVAALTRSLS